MRAAVALVLGLVGCIGEETPRADIENATVRVSWSAGTSRYVNVSIPEIPCVGTDSELLGESGERCESTPWSVSIDGVVIETKTIRCEAAHDGWFGRVDKRCEGTSMSAVLPVSDNEDVDVVIETDGEQVRHVLHGVRRTYRFAQEVAADPGMDRPGVVRVDEIELAGTRYVATFTLDGDTRTGEARVMTDTTGKLELVPPSTSDAGEYQVRVLAYTRDGDVTLAVPIEGALTVTP